MASSKFFRQRKDVEMLLRTTDMTRKEIANKVASGNVRFVDEIAKGISEGLKDETSPDEALKAVKAAQEEMQVEAGEDNKGSSLKEALKTKAKAAEPVPSARKNEKAAKSYSPRAYTIDEVVRLMGTTNDKEVEELSKDLGVSVGSLKNKRGRLRAQLGTDSITEEEADALFIHDENGLITSRVIPITQLTQKSISEKTGISVWSVSKSRTFNKGVSEETRLRVFKLAKDIYQGIPIDNDAPADTSTKTSPSKNETQDNTALSEVTDMSNSSPFDQIGQTAVSIGSDIEDIISKLHIITKTCDEECQKGKDEREKTLLKALIREDRKFFSLTNASDPTGAQKEYLRKCGFTDKEIKDYMN